jgi:hypothetical protein
LFWAETERNHGAPDKKFRERYMSGTEAVDFGSGNAVACSRRLLSAIRSGGLPALSRELTLAQRVARTPLPPTAWSSLADEQAELLDAIAQRITLSLGKYDPCAEAEIYLLGHLSLQ